MLKFCKLFGWTLGLDLWQGSQPAITCSKLTIETRTRYEVHSKLIIETPERHQWRRSDVFIVNFKHISHLALVSIVNFEHVIAGWAPNIQNAGVNLMT